MVGAINTGEERYGVKGHTGRKTGEGKDKGRLCYLFLLFSDRVNNP